MTLKSGAWRFPAKQFPALEAVLQRAAGPRLDVSVGLPSIACHVLEVCHTVENYVIACGTCFLLLTCHPGGVRLAV